jgi:hypothetical protein
VTDGLPNLDSAPNICVKGTRSLACFRVVAAFARAPRPLRKWRWAAQVVIGPGAIKVPMNEIHRLERKTCLSTLATLRTNLLEHVSHNRRRFQSATLLVWSERGRSEVVVLVREVVLSTAVAIVTCKTGNGRARTRPTKGASDATAAIVLGPRRCWLFSRSCLGSW